MKIGWLDSTTYDHHTNGPGHPERPERLDSIRTALAGSSVSRYLVRVDAPQVDRPILERIHAPRYVSEVEALCNRGGGHLDPDTSLVPQSWDAALRAAGAVSHAVKQVLQARGNVPSAPCALPVTTLPVRGEWAFACLTTLPLERKPPATMEWSV